MGIDVRNRDKLWKMAWWCHLATGMSFCCTVGCTVLTELPGDGSDAGSCSSADLNSDPRHCGRCSHSCDGDCANGMCVPIEFATNQSNPRGIVVDDTYVYWVNTGTPGMADGSLNRQLKSGGGVETLVAQLYTPWGLARDETHLYFSVYGNGDAIDLPGRLWRIPLGASDGAELVAGGFYRPRELFVSDDAVFVAERNKRVFRIAKSDGAATIFLPPDPATVDPGLGALAVFQDRLYVNTVKGMLWSFGLPTSDSPTLAFSGSGDGYGVAVSSEGIYFCSRSRPAEGRQLWYLAPPLPGELIAAADRCIYVLTLGDDVFWTQESVTAPLVSSYNRSTKAIVVHAQHPEAGSDPTGLAVDQTHIYWAAMSSNSVRRVNR